MRQRLLRSLTAGMLAATLCVAGNAQPAQAAPTGVQPMAIDPYSIIIEIGINLLSSAFSSGGVSEGDLNQAVAQITAQIAQSKAEIINHIDAVASAEVQACVRTNTIEFASINSMSRTVLQLWAQNATACATKATAYLNALVSPAAVDHIGWLVGEIFTIVIAARTKAGLTEGLDLVLEDEVSAFNSVAVKLQPRCTSVFTPVYNGAVIWRTYTCVAYNNNTASGSEYYSPAYGPRIDEESIRRGVMAGTSWPQALDTLPRLRELLP